MSWQDCKLGDVLTLKRGHDLPEKHRVPGDVPVVSSSGFTGSHNQAKAEPPGVVTGRYGTIGEVFFVDKPYWPLNTALYVVDFKGTDPKFAAYLLRNTLRNYQTEKAAVPGVDRNVLHMLKVRAPGANEQKAIVSILSAYDDLIETNRRRIALLEEAARLLYREWFVHFRFPGHEHIPVSEGLPEGWQRRPLGSFTTKIGSGATPRGGQSSYKTKGVSLIRSQNVYDYKFDTGGLAFIDEKQADALSNVKVQAGDILLNITGASVGRCCSVPARVLPARVNQHVMIIRCDQTEIPPAFLLFCLNSHEQKEGLMRIAAAAGATREALTKDIVSGFSIPVPRRPLLDAFCEFVDPLLTQSEALETANQKLAEARDLLLPRLMNGEIAV